MLARGDGTDVVGTPLSRNIKLVSACLTLAEVTKIATEPVRGREAHYVQGRKPSSTMMALSRGSFESVRQSVRRKDPGSRDEPDDWPT